MTSSQSDKGILFKPIGVIRTGMQLKFDAPHQPDRNDANRSIVELFPEKGFREALSDIQGFSHIWLLWWFHKNPNWRPMVRPPRGSGRRRGVFATRSPHRPNPIGMTAVPLLGVSGTNLIIGSHDLVDGTPILDIKPYLTTADCFPDATSGWLAEIEDSMKAPVACSVITEPEAAKQIGWLKEKGISFTPRAFQILERDPSPHRTRRIRKAGDELRMSCGAWRIFFRVIDKDKEVRVTRIAPGYPMRHLIDPGYTAVPHRDAQLEFLEIWPSAVTTEEPEVYNKEPQEL